MKKKCARVWVVWWRYFLLQYWHRATHKHIDEFGGERLFAGAVQIGAHALRLFGHARLHFLHVLADAVLVEKRGSLDGVVNVARFEERRFKVRFVHFERRAFRILFVRAQSYYFDTHSRTVNTLNTLKQLWFRLP